MKKLKAFWGKIPHPLQVIFILIVIGLVLFIIFQAPCKINRFQVQSITMTTENGPILSKSDASKFMLIFNATSFRCGKQDYDPHPSYRFVVTYRNGKHLEIYDYGGKLLRVERYDKDGSRTKTYQVRSSNWLRSYAKELHDQQYDSKWPNACEH